MIGSEGTYIRERGIGDVRTRMYVDDRSVKVDGLMFDFHV